MKDILKKLETISDPRQQGIKSIGMVQNTYNKSGNKVIEKRYYITSEQVDMELFEKCCRGHWTIESMHWHLDVTFKEDQNKTLERTTNQNLTIIRKWALAILKTIELSSKKCSQKLKRYRIGINPTKYIQNIFEI
jgi:predicted transposase YbfD/YdcC